jgi:5-methylcytosine-specific restriction endonuclease McrA
MLITEEQARKRLESPKNACNIMRAKREQAERLKRDSEQSDREERLKRPIWERLGMMEPDPALDALLKEMGLDHASLRRSKRVAMREGIPAKLYFRVTRKGGGACHYCGRRPPEVAIEVDHLIPVSRGGTNDFENLVPACRECNRSKGAQLLEDSVDDRALDLFIESLGLKGN